MAFTVNQRGGMDDLHLILKKEFITTTCFSTEYKANNSEWETNPSKDGLVNESYALPLYLQKAVVTTYKV